MLKTLLKIKLRGMLNKRLTVKSGGKKDKFIKGAFILLMVYAIACFLGMFGSLFFQIAHPLHEQNLEWLYFTMAGVLAFLLMFVGSIFTAKSQMYEAKDNELLLSMPIPSEYILASRLVLLLVFNLFWGALIMLPAEVVYCITVSFNILEIVYFILAFLLLSLLSLALSCIFGWIVTVISSKCRNKSAITTVVSLVLFFGYFYFFNGMDSYIQKITTNGAEIANSIKLKFFPAFLFGEAVAGENLLYLLIVGGSILAFCFVVHLFLSRGFAKIVNSQKGLKKVKYKEKELSISGIKTALLKKELARFAMSPVYMLNTAIGVIFTLIGVVALIINNDLINILIRDMPELDSYINPLAIAVLCFISATNIISAPSVSLEGKNIWLLKALPVKAGDILTAKANLHILICLPVTLFASVVLASVLKMPVLMNIILFVLPALVVIFSAFLGVIISLHFPKIDWESEAVAVKQGMSTMIAMFSGFGMVILPIVLYMIIMRYISLDVYLVCVGIMLFVGCWVMYRYLVNRCEKLFENIM